MRAYLLIVCVLMAGLLTLASPSLVENDADNLMTSFLEEQSQADAEFNSKLEAELGNSLEDSVEPAIVVKPHKTPEQRSIVMRGGEWRPTDADFTKSAKDGSTLAPYDPFHMADRHEKIKEWRRKIRQRRVDRKTQRKYCKAARRRARIRRERERKEMEEERKQRKAEEEAAKKKREDAMEMDLMEISADIKSDVESELEAEQQVDAEQENQDELQAENDALEADHDLNEMEAEMLADVDVDADAEMEAELEDALATESETETESEEEPSETIMLETDVSANEMIDAQLTDNLEAELYDLPESAFKLTKFEQYMADKMEQEEQQQAMMETESEIENPAVVSTPAVQLPIPRKIHINVQTASKGGEGADNLLRVEQQFDVEHDKIMSKLNRVLSRVKRHPDSIVEKTAAYDFTLPATTPSFVETEAETETETESEQPHLLPSSHVTVGREDLHEEAFDNADSRAVFKRMEHGRNIVRFSKLSKSSGGTAVVNGVTKLPCGKEITDKGLFQPTLSTQLDATVEAADPEAPKLVDDNIDVIKKLPRTPEIKEKVVADEYGDMPAE